MINGTQIRAARERAKLSQQDLANIVGVSLRTIGNWERGETVPRNREQALRDALHLSVGEEATGRPLEHVTDAALISELGIRLLEGQLYKAERNVFESRLTIAELPPPTPEELAERDRKSNEMLLGMLEYLRSQGLDPVVDGGFDAAEVQRLDDLTASAASGKVVGMNGRRSVPSEADETLPAAALDTEEGVDEEPGGSDPDEG